MFQPDICTVASKKNEMSKYKIIKREDKYFHYYRATLYKWVQVWRWGFWIDYEVVKGKEWFVMQGIAFWQEKYGLTEFEDRTEL